MANSRTRERRSKFRSKVKDSTVHQRQRHTSIEPLEARHLLASFGHVFEDINPDTSDADSLDPIAASGGRVNFMSGVPGDTQTFYAASEFGGLYKSTDGGQSWDHLDGHLPQVMWDVEVDPNNGSRVFATSFYDGRLDPLSGIQISQDAGATWIQPLTSYPDPTLEGTASDNTPQADYNAAMSRRTEPSAFGIAIRPDAPNEVYVGTNAGLAISMDSGATWQIIDPEIGLPGDDGTALNVWDVVVQPAMPGFPSGIIDIVGDDGHLRSTDQGVTWTRPDTLGTLPTGISTIAVSPDESYVLFVAASDSNLYESDDAGATWTLLGSPDRRRQGRLQWVQANQRSDILGFIDVFDIWYGDVGLFRASCTSQNAMGGGTRCPVARTGPITGNPGPPANWNGPFTRPAGAHDDVGDVIFDNTVTTDACPLIFSNDGGIYYNDDTNSPGCHSPSWEEPDPTPHGLWLFGMTCVDVPGDDDEEHCYFDAQDNGFFASTDAGAASPSWHNTWGADSFDVAADDDTVLYNRGSFGGAGRSFRMFFGAAGAPGFDPMGTEINMYPAGGLLPTFRFTETVANYADDSYVMLTIDCTNPSSDGVDNDNDMTVDNEASNGCPVVAAGGSDGGVFVTSDITATPIAWTELADNMGNEPFNSAALVGVQVAVDAGVPTFYVQVGALSTNNNLLGGDGRSADQLWKYVGAAANGTWTRIDTNLPGNGIGVFGVDPNNSNRLYASSDPTGTPGMYFSTDGGTTWNPDTTLDNLMQGGGVFPYLNQRGPTRFFGFNAYPQPSLVAFDAEDSNNIVAGGQDSGVFLSTDGGQSWRLLTDPFGTADDPSTPEDDVPHIPRPRYAHFDHEPTGETRIIIGSQGYGVRRITVDFDKEADKFEEGTNNNSIGTATILGSLPEVTLRDLSIHNAADVDYYKYTAHDTGKLIVNMFFDGLLGDLDIRVRDRFGNIIASGTQSNIAPQLDNEQIVIPVVSQEEYFIEVFSSLGHTNCYDLEIENFPAPVPISVLLDRADDTGRNNSDDITAEDAPRVFVLADLTDFDNMGIDILSADDVDANMPGAAVEVVVAGQAKGFADPVGGSNSNLFEFTFEAGDLSEGLNLISAAVRIFDGQSPTPADGRAQLSLPLLLTLDTIAPTGTVALHPDSDTGVWGFPATMMDGITTDKTPLFYGATEADAVVRVEIDGVPAGTTVAVPLDGNEAFPPPPEFDGNYLLQTILALGDGEHTIQAFFRDVAGNESPAAEDAALAIFLDTVGPRITNVTRGLVSTDNNLSFDGDTSLFEPKPSETGPDPLIHSIVVHFSDLPDRTDTFDYDALLEALAEEEGNYQLTGDHNGNIAIVEVNPMFFTTNGDDQPETAEVELVFTKPLPDDRYTLWVSERITDPAGNKLDGESGAVGPFEGNDVPLETPPIFPTGDGAHGGDFTARFTIDSRPEIGTYALGSTYIDINGNFVFDPEGKDRDYTNRDIEFLFGFRDDRVFAGNFAPAGAASASGFDKVGAYGTLGQGPQAWHWRLDFDHDGVIDLDVVSGVQVQGDPVAGDFTAAHQGDEIGLFNGGKWYLDTTGNNNIGDAGDTQLQGDMRGQPIVGDFDGDGLDDLATWDPGNAGNQFDGVFSFDLANNGLTGDAEMTIQFDISGVFQKAVAADMNADGIDDIGLFVTRREGVPPEEAAEWFFLISDDPTPPAGALSALNHPFTPVPFGTDIFAQFGDEAAAPVVGNFDPPTRSHVLDRIHGDFDGNGLVAQGDLDLVLLGWGRSGSDLPPGWRGADGSLSGMIDQGELDAVLLNWGQANTTATVSPPEPAQLLQEPVKGQTAAASRTPLVPNDLTYKAAREGAFAALGHAAGFASAKSSSLVSLKNQLV